MLTHAPVNSSNPDPANDGMRVPAGATERGPLYDAAVRARRPDGTAVARHTAMDTALAPDDTAGPIFFEGALPSLDLVEFTGTSGPVAINPARVDAVIHINAQPPSDRPAGAAGPETEIIIGGRTIRVVNSYQEVMELLAGEDTADEIEQLTAERPLPVTRHYRR